MVDCYIGEIRMFASYRNVAPEGWAFCDGSQLSIAANQVLYSLIGTTYGGDGVNKFALPDYRSRLPIGTGTEPGTSTVYKQGNTGGLETVPLTAANMPAHTHTWSVSTNNATEIGPSGNLYAAVPSGTSGGKPTGGLYMDSSISTFKALQFDNSVIGPAGSSTPLHENRMPSTAIAFIIALQGTYPVRP